MTQKQAPYETDADGAHSGEGFSIPLSELRDAWNRGKFLEKNAEATTPRDELIKYVEWKKQVWNEDLIKELALALEIAAVCNSQNMNWNVRSAFQNKIDDLLKKAGREEADALKKES